MKAMKTELRLSIPVGTWVRIEKMAKRLKVSPNVCIERMLEKGLEKVIRSPSDVIKKEGRISGSAHGEHRAKRGPREGGTANAGDGAGRPRGGMRRG